MDFDLREAVRALNPNEVFEIANQARPPGDYLFNNFLPNRNEDSYNIEESSITIRTTMAGMSGMDSKYAEGGAAEEHKRAGKTGKITINSPITEVMLRKLQRMLQVKLAKGLPTNDSIQKTALNFFNKIIIQAITDREEWLKGQALFTGKLDWTFNGINLKADYGYPAANIFAKRTGGDYYGGATSKFWDDFHDAQEILNWDVRAVVLHPTTLKIIMANAENNNLEFISTNAKTGVFKFRRTVQRGGNTQLSSDPRDEITMIAYNKEGEVFKTADHLGDTTKVPFCPVGAIMFIGAPISNSNTFIVDDGSTPAVDESKNRTSVAIGYGHVAPTVEGGGTSGRWGRIRVPDDRPWSIEGDGVENYLPVIQAYKRIVIASTDLT